MSDNQIFPSLSNPTTPTNSSAFSSWLPSSRSGDDQRLAPRDADISLSSNPTYKKYSQAVDRSLNSFLDVQEWADFIAFLAKLLKAIQSYPQFNDIPHKLIVSKRLSQCLNPALPTGVHQKALEVYDKLFAIMGTDGLKRDLQMWSTSLFPFFQYAAISVRPLVLELYKSHYFPLRSHLRPIIKSMTLSLLPGLEEENGEHFDDALSMLDYLSSTTALHFFLQNLCLILITSPASRISTLNYLLRKMPPLDTDDQIIMFLSSDANLLIRGVSASLMDNNMLVRRSALDLLISSLPTGGPALQKFSRSDFRVDLCRNACNVVLRKDISLNRRLFTWLLGTSDDKESLSSYFNTFGLPLISSWMLADMDTTKSFDSRPYKIFISLLDKWEIGHNLTKCIVSEIISCLECRLKEDVDRNADVKIITSMVLESIDIYLLWKAMNHQLQSDFTNQDDTCRSIELITMIVDNISFEEEAHTCLHFPIQLLNILKLISVNRQANRKSVLTERAFILAQMLINHIPEKVMNETPWIIKDSQKVVSSWDYVADAEYTDSIDIPEVETPDTFYEALLKRLIEINLSWSEDVADSMMVKSSFSTLYTLLTLRYPRKQLNESFGDMIAQLFTALLKLVSISNQFETTELLIKCLLTLRQTCFSDDSVYLQWMDREAHETLLNALLPYLAPQYFDYHFRCVKLIVEIENTTAQEHITSILAQRLNNDNDQPARLQVIHQCGIIYSIASRFSPTHFDLTIPVSRFFTVNSSDTTAAEDSQTNALWLKKYFDNSGMVTRSLIAKISKVTQASRTVERQYLFNTSAYEYFLNWDQEIAIYSLQQLTKLSKHIGQSFWEQLGRLDESESELSLLQLSLRILQSEPNQGIASSIQPGNEYLQMATMELLEEMFIYSRKDSDVFTTAAFVISNYLNYHVQLVNLDVQPRAIKLVTCALQHCDLNNVHSSNELGQTVVKLLRNAISNAGCQSLLKYWINFTSMILDKYSMLIRDHKLDMGNIIYSKLSDMLHTNNLSVSFSDHKNLSSVLSSLNAILVINLDDLHTSMIHGSPNIVEQTMSLMGVSFKLLTSLYFTLKNKQSGTFDYLTTQCEGYIHNLFEKRPYEMLDLAMEYYQETLNKVTLLKIFKLFSDPSRILVHYICKNIGMRSFAGDEKPRSLWQSDAISSSMLFESLEVYLGELSVKDALQSWVALQPFARDVIVSTTSAQRKLCVYPTLRCIHIVGLRIFNGETTEIVEKKVKMDYQDILHRFIDSSILISTGGSDTGPWALKKALAGLDVANVTGTNEDSDRDSVSVNSLAEKLDGDSSKIYLYMANELLVDLPNLISSTEKLQSIAANISYCVVAPALKSTSKGTNGIQPHSASVDVLVGLTRLPHCSKSWKGLVSDVFYDNRFFNASKTHQWKYLVNALMSAEKDKFKDLVSKVSSAPSTNIFANREYESLSRALNLRRLSYAIFAGNPESYTSQLPLVKEKLVEVVRNNAITPVSQSEIYLCLRVLLVRFKSDDLTTFWPIVNTELLRLFDIFTTSPSAEHLDLLPLLLSACKLLDTLLLLQNEDFQAYQSLFITDTVDASCDGKQYGIIDKLSGLFGQEGLMGASEKSFKLQINSEKRQPLLTNVRKISQMGDLSPFYRALSSVTYNNVLDKQDIDWELLERTIEDDFFDE
ncbi:Protein dopey-1 [Wallemia ichthyophaga EXF-994]|uniref:Protein dopey-1 n=1 Tax=Wallemia ichthyophaga (strain EXF-994 / CBS 113033) TaxID=1299270 RepID=R9AMX0_WALI9|nr:Protein dopey-1 [Wallemia ichthyophaga EXF-994]EOR01446.1 Protein dopey-1 [Wallemia ichthyophaga EXF-994]TIB34701.1 hypothetical protein E3P84_01644 [Wallemia ichthyophaga]TIB41793.1 hypothetical protein E3P83_01593 [Wallemia ichthyophaga]